MLSGHGVGTYQENELTRNLSGNTRPQSSQLAEPLSTDPNIKSGISVHDRISTGNEMSNILPESSTRNCGCFKQVLETKTHL